MRSRQVIRVLTKGGREVDVKACHMAWSLSGRPMRRNEAMNKNNMYSQGGNKASGTIGFRFHHDLLVLLCLSSRIVLVMGGTIVMHHAERWRRPLPFQPLTIIFGSYGMSTLST